MPTLELPAVSASKEFLDALFDKHNIDGEQISSKSVVDKEFRQTLGSPQNNQLVEAISHAIVSHANPQRQMRMPPLAVPELSGCCLLGGRPAALGWSAYAGGEAGPLAAQPPPPRVLERAASQSRRMPRCVLPCRRTPV